MLPRAAERLPRALGFGAEPLAERPVGLCEQLLVELVAILRRCAAAAWPATRRNRGVPGRLPLVPEAIKIVPASTAAASNISSSAASPEPARLGQIATRDSSESSVICCNTKRR